MCLIAVLAAAGAAISVHAGAQAGSEPKAATTAANPTVGALFDGALSAGHDCSGSVLAGATRDLVLTAAHCVSGTGTGLTFVPGYDEGAAPYGVYRVVAAYVDPRWLAGQDPAHDFAVLRVVPVSGDRPIEDVTGGNRLGRTPRDGTLVTDVAYNQGVGDAPVSCRAAVEGPARTPTFACQGFVDGSSGSPWLVRVHGRTEVVGVIGGLYQGGCRSDVSYSSPFGAAVRELVARAEARGAPDVLPVPGPSGC